MLLQPGARLGPYEILDRVGKGGMGEVYRARDTRLARSVAIKVLSEGSPARFEREAKAISALNHPHICSLHDVGNENGIDYLVMEYCEGPTLAERLERGALPLDQVLRYGIEIAEALSRAHRAGIVHRDLKPSNVKITASGAKLLDFGIAKRSALADGGETTSLQEGVVGTVQYMAPEVLSGREADARSDIFALGLVLYEMLAGAPAFVRTSNAGVIAAILEHEPRPLAEVRAGVPAALDHLIDRCLAKNPDERWESAHDVAEELRWLRDARPATAGAPARRRHLALILGATALIALALLVAVRFALRRSEPAGPVARLALAMPPGASVVVDGGAPNIAISADAKRVAYLASVDGVRRLYVRPLDSLEPTPLATTGAVVAPVFSPDGRTIAFDQTGSIRTTDAAGAVTSRLLYSRRVGSSRGVAWAADGTIYFSPDANSGIWKRAPNGAAQPLTTPDAAAGENSHRWPQVLPDGKHILFTIRSPQILSFDDARIAVLALDTGKWKVVLEGGTFGRFVAPDHLLFARGGAIYEVPFDLATMTVTGERRKVVNGVVVLQNSGAADFDVAADGTLVYLPGNAPAAMDLVAVNRGGGAEKLLVTLPFRFDSFRLSPDGRKVAVHANSANDDIWTCDLATGRLTRLSFEGGDEGSPRWMPDGSGVAYGAFGEHKMLLGNVDGSGSPRLLLPRSAFPNSISPDGKLLVYSGADPATGMDLWQLPIDGSQPPRPFLRTPFNEGGAEFSPDGKWIAYVSNETGRPEVYVRAASGQGGRWQVSSEIGMDPRWSKDGRELFFRRGDTFLAAPIAFGATSVDPGKPQVLFTKPGIESYEVLNDGFILGRHDRGTFPQINVVLNFRRELRR